MVFKIICLVLLTLCGGAFMLMPKLISERKHKNSSDRLRLVTKIRAFIFLAMLVLLLLCILIR